MRDWQALTLALLVLQAVSSVGVVLLARSVRALRRDGALSSRRQPAASGGSTQRPWTVLVFLSPECGMCRDLASALGPVAVELGADHRVLAVVRDDAQAFAAEERLSVPLAVDAAALFERHGVAYTPTVVVLDSDGDRLTDSMAFTSHDLLEIVRAAGRPEPTPLSNGPGQVDQRNDAEGLLTAQLQALDRVLSSDELRPNLIDIADTFTVVLDGVGSSSHAFTDGERADIARLRLTVTPHAFDAFWLGEGHEPAALLSGALTAEGPLRSAVALVERMPALSSAYRLERAVDDEVAGRLPTLRFHDPLRHLDAAQALTVLTSAAQDQQLLAVLILVGLPPACRALEIEALRTCLDQGSIDHAALAAVAEWLARLAHDRAATSRAFHSSPTTNNPTQKEQPHVAVH